jgi:hypothetical protein
MAIEFTNGFSLSKVPPPTYTIGQTALGGVIAYINGGGSTGTSGLVATLSLGSNCNWGCEGTDIPGATATAIGTGAANTVAIVNACNQSNIAAKLASDLTEGGYSDWYLPSYDELYQLYVNRNAIGGFGGEVEFWSSTQFNSTNAYAIFLFDGSWRTPAKTANIFYRAIRNF